MENVKIVKAIVLESTAFTAAKKYTGFLLSIPRTLFNTWLQFQLKAISVCIVIVLGALRLLPWRKQSSSPPITDNTIPKVPLESESSNPDVSKTEEPKSEEIVKNTKKLRNCVAISMTKITGQDLFWDLPILTAKTERLFRAIDDDDPRKKIAAKKALEAHRIWEPMPKSKEEYDRLLKEAMTDIYDYPDPEPTKNEVSEEMEYCGRISEGGDVQLQSANMNGPVKRNGYLPIDKKDQSKKKVNFCLDNASCSSKAATCRHDAQLAMQNRLLKSRLNMTNYKLEEMLRSSNGILDEVIRLNEQFSKLTTVSSKISSLQHELGEGKQLLKEVEEERNEMKLKLIALEKLIKEEEEYLDDLSCESGYEEVEHCYDDSTDEI